MSRAPSWLAFRPALWHNLVNPAKLAGSKSGSRTVTDIVLVQSSDLHVDNDPHQGPYGADGTTGLRVVLEAAKAHDAHIVLLVGDIFDNNRQPDWILKRCTALLAYAGRPVVFLPG